MATRHNARNAKVEIDYTDLMNLANRSDFIDIVAIDPQPGWPPERYLITFTCAGIARIDSGGAPIVSTHHQVELYLSADYPARFPSLVWRTEIWHPNIDHQEPRHVCMDEVTTFFPGKPLSEVVIALVYRFSKIYPYS